MRWWPWRRRRFTGGHIPSPPETRGVPVILSPGAYSAPDELADRYGTEVLDAICATPAPAQRRDVDCPACSPDIHVGCCDTTVHRRACRTRSTTTLQEGNTP